MRVTKRRAVDNLLGLAVLAYLTQGPMHAYQLSRTLRRNGDDRSIQFNHGSLYMVVRQLVRAGLIAPAGTSRAGRRPERTHYRLTPAGRTELHAWLQDLVAEPRHEYPSYVAALSLIGALPPAEVIVLLRNRLERLATQRAEITALVAQARANGVHPLFLVEEDYRLAVLEADVAFTERFIARIEDPNDGWKRLWEEVHRQQQPAIEH
jgi:DNA-binding PadR family transcriptional regulator